MLEYEQVIPRDAKDGAPLLVLMHGRGADRFDLLDFAPMLAPDAVAVCPQAPWPGQPWGYGPGWAWYRFLGRNLPEPQSFERSQQELGAFLEQIRGALPVRTGTLVLGGFSQGGVMAMGYAVRNPGTVPLVMNFSGFFPQHPSVHPSADAVRGTRFWWGHGTMDPSIPFETGEEGRAVLRQVGADLTTRDYAMGHGIGPDEVRDARAWLSAALAGTPPTDSPAAG